MCKPLDNKILFLFYFLFIKNFKLIFNFNFIFIFWLFPKVVTGYNLQWFSFLKQEVVPPLQFRFRVLIVENLQS
jgi:hypothetical protein